MANSVFRDVIDFLGKLGIYDVLLPFLLTFTITFAILEKSKVLGTEKIGGEQRPRKSLNSIASFVVGFLVVGSGQLVALINQAVAQTVVLLLIGVLFMTLIGTFHKDEKDGKQLSGVSKWIAMAFMGIGIILIFLNAIKLKSGVSVLEYVYSYVITNGSGTVVSTVIFLGLVVLGMAWITGSFSGLGSKSGEDK